MKVYKCINQVQAALAKTGIAKDQRNSQQGFSFRGIDAIYNALAPLLADAGLCILPKVLGRSVTERTTAKGGILFCVIVEMEFTFVSPEDGSSHVISTFGEAMDSGDKATNKAMSAAYKYAAMQAFCIPTEGDNDADAHTHEVVKPLAPSRTEIKESPFQTLIDALTNKGYQKADMQVWYDRYNVKRMAELNDAQVLEVLKEIGVKYE